MSFILNNKKPAGCERCMHCNEWVTLGQDGGRIELPRHILGYSQKVVLHNKCLNQVLKGGKDNVRCSK